MDPITIFIVATLMMLANGGVLGLMHKDLPVSLQPCAETWRIATLLLAGSAVLYAVQYEWDPLESTCRHASLSIL